MTPKIEIDGDRVTVNGTQVWPDQSVAAYRDEVEAAYGRGAAVKFYRIGNQDSTHIDRVAGQDGGWMWSDYYYYIAPKPVGKPVLAIHWEEAAREFLTTTFEGAGAGIRNRAQALANADTRDHVSVQELVAMLEYCDGPCFHQSFREKLQTLIARAKGEK